MSDEGLKLVQRYLEVSGESPPSVARELGCSERTVQRWRLGTGVPLAVHLRKLAERIHKKDATLARDIYDHIDEFHRAQGLPLPERPDRKAVQNEPGARMAEAALKTAAKMLNVPPDKLRPALRAALVSAQRAGATLEGFISGLDRSASE